MADDMDQIVDNLKQPSSWIRVLFMIGFAILLYVVIAPLIFILMIVQALFVLFTGDYNINLKFFGAALAQYVSQILLFISYNSEHRPFPFSDFPAIEPDDPESGENDTAEAKPAKRKTASTKKTSSKSATRKAKASDSAATDDSDQE